MCEIVRSGGVEVIKSLDYPSSNRASRKLVIEYSVNKRQLRANCPRPDIFPNTRVVSVGRMPTSSIQSRSNLDDIESTRRRKTRLPLQLTSEDEQFFEVGCCRSDANFEKPPLTVYPLVGCCGTPAVDVGCDDTLCL